MCNGNNYQQHKYEYVLLMHFIKMLLGVKSSTSAVALYAETGRFPVYLRFKITVVKYIKITVVQNMEEGKIVKTVFNMLKQYGHQL